jgi:hypothetical protein
MQDRFHIIPCYLEIAKTCVKLLSNWLSAYDRQKALDKFWSAEIGGEKPYTGTSAVRIVGRPTTHGEELRGEDNKGAISGVTSKLSVSHESKYLSKIPIVSATQRAWGHSLSPLYVTQSSHVTFPFRPTVTKCGCNF